MTEELEFKTFLSISLEGFEIFVLNNKNFENLYKQEVKFQNKTNIIHFENLNKFLEENIFKIEKIIGKFIKDIFLIIENPEIFDLNIGIKKKNYETSITKKDLETILTDAKDLFKENYENEKGAHRHDSNCHGPMSSPSFLWSPIVKKRVLTKSFDFMCSYQK